MYFAVALDGNHEPLLLAIGLGTLECEESWRWFMMKLKECLGEDTEVGFISNLCDKIDFVVHSIYPDSYHGYCPKDIARKIRDSVGHNDTEVETLFWKSCNAYSVHDFYLCLERLQNAGREPPFCTLLRSLIFWLDDIAISKWTRAFFPKVRYNVKSIDVPEMLKIISTSTREFPITTIIELINTLIQTTYAERAEVAKRLSGGVTPYVEIKVQKRINKSYNWVAKRLYTDTFQVDNNFGTNKVQFDRSTLFFTPSSSGPYMSDEIFEELKKPEEQQEQDKESSRLLTQRDNEIAWECKQAQEWIDLKKRNQRA
ncbi:uncharacterized protein LOC111893110 [Lactuca sativa]|uniref:uncharacterized protein LOC111893110 n=1 Tax=Lactuca sativa TaxID=4236 RepID=UPI0022AE988B|nr:uncharacterized protein LOC111893110 [Lactuca sativa]